MIEYLSYSSISKYTTCAEAWRRQYLEKQPQPKTPTLALGGAFHETVEAYITRDAHTPALPTLWATKWAAALEKEPNVEWGATTPEMHYNDGLRLVTAEPVVAMLNGVTPLQDEQGYFIERKVTLTVPGVPVPITGYIDVITADGVPGDFKTSSTRWSADKAASELQPLFYLAALNQMGRSVPGMTFRHYVVTKGKTVTATVHEHRHTYDEVFWLFEHIQRVYQAITCEVFMMNPGSWLCNPTYCGYWSQCRGRGGTA